MKLRLSSLFGISLMACFNISVMAQTVEPCGVEPTEEQIKFLNETRKLRQTFDAQSLKSIKDIPVQHHIIRHSDGTGGLAPSVISTLMSDLNTYYAGANLNFVECGPVHFIDDDTYYDFTTSQENAIGNANDVTNVINLYYFNTVMSGSSSYCGYTRVPPSSIDRIIVKNSCAINGSTVTHEVGHYFALYHTHGKTNTGTTDELVDGSNCTTAGDDVCDTPADPNLSGKVNGSCQYVGTDTDANGDTYNPNPNNIMSYSLKACRDFLSTGQVNRVAYSAINDRGYLLCDTTPAPICQNTITNYPYSESWETGLGLWNHSDDDDMNWIVDGFGTASANTGPSAAIRGNYYVYVEASSPNYPTKKAYLESPCFNITSLNDPELSFYYNMYGSAMGTLQVDISTDAGSTWSNTAWSLSGNQGTEWGIAQVSLANYSTATELKVRLHGTTGTSFTSDMAVDDFQIGEARYCLGPISQFPYKETFSYNDIGEWKQKTTDDLDWKVNSGHTPSAGTGPSRAADGSYYLFVESSSNYNKTAILESPCMDLGNTSIPELYFQYHMYGNAMGSLGVQASNDGGQTWSEFIWYVSGNQGIDDPNFSATIIDLGVLDPSISLNLELEPWMEAHVPIGDYAGSEVMLRMVATTGYGSTSDMAIDNLQIRTADCEQTVIVFPYLESFENGVGDWIQETNDNTDWISHSGATPSPGTGPEQASLGQKYMYVEASGVGNPNKTAGFISPCFDLSQEIERLERYDPNIAINLEISFDVHTYGADMGDFRMQISDDGGNSWVDKYSTSYDYGNYWRKVYVRIRNYWDETIRVRFLAETGDGPLSDMAIDNFIINIPTNITIYTDGTSETNESPLNLLRDKHLELSLFPNPTNDLININFDGDYTPEGKLEFRNAMGQLVYSKNVEAANTATQLQLSLGHLTSGYYFVNFNTKEMVNFKPIKFILMD